MSFRGGEFSTGTMGNFQPELTKEARGKGKRQPFEAQGRQKRQQGCRTPKRSAGLKTGATQANPPFHASG